MYISAIASAISCCLRSRTQGELRIMYQGGVTLIDSIVTAATALSQRSTVKPS